jgi:spore coat polysaccharide biosynthesis protein SpsF
MPVKGGVVAIVQARMTSTRLPGKVLMEICSRPMLALLVERLKACKGIDRIVVATSVDATDDVIEGWCRDNSVDLFRGSLDDVLDRYYNAAITYGAETIVRITADCPLIDPILVDRVIEAFKGGGCAYAKSVGSFPDGLDTEVFSFEALNAAQAGARLLSEREHVTPYIWKRPEEFPVIKIENDEDLSAMRWTVDDPADLLFVTKIFEALYTEGKVFYMDEILEFLKKNPELLKINSGTVRNEGYAKSLREDRPVNP